MTADVGAAVVAVGAAVDIAVEAVAAVQSVDITHWSCQH